MTEDTISYLQQYNGESATLEYFSSLAARGDLSYPYTEYFSPLPTDLFGQLIKHRSKFISNVKYRLSHQNGKYKFFLPPLFRGCYLILEDTNHLYDNILKIFIEKYMMHYDRPIGGQKSQYSSWCDDRSNKIIFRRSLHFPKLNHENFRASLEIHYPGIPLFNVAVAKDILEYVSGIYSFEQRYLIQPQVLDISMSWGSFLLSCMALNLTYVGYQRNLEIINSYKKMIKLLRNDYRRTLFIDNLLGNQQYDIVVGTFLSYENQLVPTRPQIFEPESIAQDVDSYLVDIILPKIERGWAKLKLEGYMILVLDDSYQNPYIEKLLLLMQEYNNSFFQGTIAYTQKKDIKPVYIWKKTSLILPSASSTSPITNLYPELANLINERKLTDRPNISNLGRCKSETQLTKSENQLMQTMRLRSPKPERKQTDIIQQLKNFETARFISNLLSGILSDETNKSSSGLV